MPDSNTPLQFTPFSLRPESPSFHAAKTVEYAGQRICEMRQLSDLKIILQLLQGGGFLYFYACSYGTLLESCSRESKRSIRIAMMDKFISYRAQQVTINNCCSVVYFSCLVPEHALYYVEMVKALKENRTMQYLYIPLFLYFAYKKSQKHQNLAPVEDIQ